MENSDKRLSEHVIGAAIEVHRALGPGLLESIYSQCLAHEMAERGIQFEREVTVLTYLRLLKVHRGLMLNFHVAALRDGIKSIVL